MLFIGSQLQGGCLQQESCFALVIWGIDKTQQRPHGIEQAADGAGVRGVATEAPELVQVADPLYR
ncbi:hypothetical protein D3C86_1413860 [compost metagenome]